MAGGRSDRGGFIYSRASSKCFHCSSPARKHNHRGLDQRVEEATTPPTHTTTPKASFMGWAEAGWLHKPLTSMLSSWSTATAGASPGPGSAPHTGPWGAAAPEGSHFLPPPHTPQEQGRGMRGSELGFFVQASVSWRDFSHEGF